MSANFNALARAARGEFLVAMGDDDRLLPEFVSRLVAVMRPELGVAFSNHYLLTPKGRGSNRRAANIRGTTGAILSRPACSKMRTRRHGANRSRCRLHFCALPISSDFAFGKT